MAKIGFIGLGHMGSRMAKNLINAGHELIVYDLKHPAIQNLVNQGANAANSLKDIALNSDVIFTMLQNSDEVVDVCLAPDGLFNHMAKETLYIDTSSININVCRDLHMEAENQGLSMIDAPVSGGVKGAEDASLTIMVGGHKDDFEKAKKYLDILGKKVVYTGIAGNGQAAKICNNMVLGISMIGVSEAFVLAKKLGLDPKVFFDVANNSSAQCWSLSNYCPEPNVLDNVPADHDYEPGFTARMMLKDLRLSQKAATSVNVSTPLGANAAALYSLFVNGGYGEKDFSGIIKFLEGEI